MPKKASSKKVKQRGVVQKLLQQDVKHLERLTKSAQRGRWETAPKPSLADPWRTVLEAARPDTVVIAISDASPKWWEQATEWLPANKIAIKRGAEFIRIFIVDDEKDLGPHGTLAKEFLEVMGAVAQAGIQVNVVKASNLEPGLRRDVLLVNVSVPDAADPLNTEKNIIAEKDAIAGITAFAQDRIRPVEAVVFEQTREVAEHINAATKIYRASIRFPHPNWYSGGYNWLDAYYDKGYKKIAAAWRDHLTEDEIGFLVKILGLKENSRASILDHGCAYGRLMIPILEKFPRVSMMGFDHSKSYIEELNETLARQGLDNRGRAFIGDFERLDEFLPIIGDFDFSISMFASFGHDLVANPENLTEVLLDELKGLRNALKPGGKLVLDIDNIGFMKNLSGKQDVQQNVERFDRLEEGKDFLTRRRSTQFVLHSRRGVRAYHTLARLILFTPKELTNLFKEAGLRVKKIFGHVILESGKPIPWNENSPRMVFFAERPRK